MKTSEELLWYTILKLNPSKSDRGSEFRSFTNYLKEFGIIHKTIYPHTHYQNGVFKQKRKKIVELDLTLLAHASLASLTSVYPIDRLPIAPVFNFKSY